MVVIHELNHNYLGVNNLAVRELQPHFMCAPNIWKNKH